MARTRAERLEFLKTLRDAWEDAYAAAITLVGTLGPKPDYSIDGQSVSWQSMYTNGPKVIEDLTKLVNQASWAAGPVDTAPTGQPNASPTSSA